MNIMKFYDQTGTLHLVKTSTSSSKYRKYPFPAQAEQIAAQRGWTRTLPPGIVPIREVRHFGRQPGIVREILDSDR